MDDFNVVVTKNGAPDDAIQVVYVYEDEPFEPGPNGFAVIEVSPAGAVDSVQSLQEKRFGYDWHLDGHTLHVNFKLNPDAGVSEASTSAITQTTPLTSAPSLTDAMKASCADVFNDELHIVSTGATICKQLCTTLRELSAQGLCNAPPSYEAETPKLEEISSPAPPETIPFRPHVDGTTFSANREKQITQTIQDEPINSLKEPNSPSRRRKSTIAAIPM